MFVEFSGIVRISDGRIAAEDYYDFPVHVNAGVIIPPIFRCDGTIADKYQACGRYVNFLVWENRPGNIIVTRSEGYTLSTRQQMQGAMGESSPERDGLRPAAIWRAGLQAYGFALRNDISDALFFARCTRQTSLVSIGGEFFNVPQEMVSSDLRCRFSKL